MSLFDNDDGRGATLVPVKILPPGGFPHTVNPEDLTPTKWYAIAILFPGYEYKIDGPFRPTGEIVPIRNSPPLTGQFRLEALFEESSAQRKILIPAFGFQAIKGIQYSLHELSEETLKFFERYNKNVTLIEDHEWSCWKTDDKYHD